MILSFAKYQATGNDFVLIDDRKSIFPRNAPNLIAKLCDRRFGIGSDGLILIQNHPEQDFEMIFFNPDGSKSLCGNGSRCAVAFARELSVISEQTSFLTTDGIHRAHFEDDIIHFQLRDIDKMDVLDHRGNFFVCNGSPHHVRMVRDADRVDVIAEGRRVRNSKAYQPAGVNVNFVELQEGKIRVRTYERGVEHETLSCGTGVVASALAASLRGYKSPVNIQTKGGELKVFFQKEKGAFTKVYLAGPAKKVFAGIINTSIIQSHSR